MKKRSQNSTLVDAIVILGGGVDTHGTISAWTKERLEGFLKSKYRNSHIPLVLSGRYSGFAKDVPKISEAQAMRRYLIRRKSKLGKIYLETKSLDTVSNAIFSLQIVRKHINGKKILLLTSPWHMKRALWIFKKIFGKNYQLTPFPVGAKNKDTTRKKSEKYLLAMAEIFLSEIQLRRKTMIQGLREIHPFFSHSKIAKRLLEEIAQKQKTMLA